MAENDCNRIDSMASSEQLIGQLLLALVLITVGGIVARISYWLIKNQAARITGPATAKTLGKFTQYLILFIFLTVTILALFGVNSTTIGIITGAIAFALTFGFQNVIQNIVGGLMIAIDGRIRLGDWIEVGDQPLQIGPAEVLDIGLTTVTTREVYGRLYVIPSSYLIIHKVVNYSNIGCFNVNITLAIPSNQDPERLLDIFMDEARKNPWTYPNVRPTKKVNQIKKPSRFNHRLTEKEKVVLDFEEGHFHPSVHITGRDGEKVLYNIILWTDSPLNIKNATTSYMIQVENRLKGEEISS